MSLEIVKHRNLLLKILKDIFTEPSVGPILGFRGGTAAYLFYGLTRFSVDLDFDLLDESQEENVSAKIKTILLNYGTLKQEDKKRFTTLYVLSYDDKLFKAQNIKVEINRRSFNSKYVIESYLGIPMKVMVKEDMFAHKLVAMYERVGRANRDIFDINYFMHNSWKANRMIIETRMNMSYKEFITKCIKMLEKVKSSELLAGMGELLTDKQKIWVKTNLIKDTIFLLNLEIEY